jgi:hypothetical protein
VRTESTRKSSVGVVGMSERYAPSGYSTPRSSVIGDLLAALAATALMTSCDSHSSSRNPQLANGWVTNCSGPEFSKFSQNGHAGRGPERPVFKINDHLVLAVPKENWPSTTGIDGEPHECKKLNDVPLANFLYFVIRGNWSAGYKPEDVPIVSGERQFQPDIITVRIQREIINPLSVEEQRKVKQILEEFRKKEAEGSREVGGLTCSIPNYAGSPPHCSGSRPNSEVHLSYSSYSATPFVFVNAEYPSSRYGRIQVYWQGWTSDISHALDIDAAIWKSIADWNLLNNTESQAQKGAKAATHHD